MARRYHLGVGRKLVNRLVTLGVRAGLGPKNAYLLSVRGRKSGKPMTTPVNVVVRGEDRFLVAPYGERAWVKNARAAGRVELRRGKRRETLGLTELDAETAAPVLQQYLRETPITKAYFDAQADSHLDAFVREAPRHPVFRLGSVDSG